jgi:hypothetical protein
MPNITSIFVCLSLRQGLVHAMFFEFCGVEMGNDKTKRTEGLCAVRPLENGEPFRVVDDKEIWHPNWRGEIKDPGNSKFLTAVVERVWQNEKVSAPISKEAYTYTSYRCSENLMAKAKWRRKLFPSP